MATEIYRIKFGHYTNENGIPCYRMYTLGATGDVDGEYLTPQKITISKKKGTVKVVFAELGIIHEFAYTPNVEVFRREKHAKEIQTDNQ